MGENRGSAIVLVLLILAAVSLIGVGVIKLSNVDIQFTKAMKGYDEIFALADGACFMAYKELANKKQDPDYLGQRMVLFNPPPNPPPNYGYQGTEPGGDYTASLVFENYTTKCPPGWDCGTQGFYQEFWIGQGKGQQRTRVGRVHIEAATTKTKRRP